MIGVAETGGTLVDIQVRPFGAGQAGVSIPAEGEIHVWYAQLPMDSFQQSPSILSLEECARAARFKVERSRDEFLLARVVLRTLAGAYLGIRPQEVKLDQEANAKPCLDSSHASCLRFNLSHSEGLTVAAFCRDARIGIDVEKVRHNFAIEDIWERFFSVAERKALRAVPSSEQYEAFFRCWTRKEAYIKARGEGLSHPLHQFDVSIDAKNASLLATRPEPEEADRWSIYSVPMPEGYIAAVAIERPAATANVARAAQHRALTS